MSRAATFTNQSSDVSPDYLRDYHAKVLEARVFGAFLSAIEFRKESEGLTQRVLADGIGRSEDNVSKLLAGPRNWTLKTISDLAGALGVDFQFALVDRRNLGCMFTDTGPRFHRPPSTHVRSSELQSLMVIDHSMPPPTVRVDQSVAGSSTRADPVPQALSFHEATRVAPSAKSDPTRFLFRVEPL